LCLKLFPWADFRENKGGIKLTVKLDHQGKIPCFAVESNAREHGAKKAREAPYEAGDVLVFDRGYVDYGYFASICGEKAYFVTRLKKNAAYKRVKRVSLYDFLCGTSPPIKTKKLLECQPEFVW